MLVFRAFWIAALAAPSFGQSFSGATYGAGGSPQTIAAGDVNGDAKLDLVTGNSGDTASVLLGNGAGAFGAAAIVALPSPAASVALGDVNGDGKLDLAIAPAGFFSEVTVLIGTGTGGFIAPTTYATGMSPNAVRLADVNANGVLDLIVGCGDGTISSRLGNGSGGFGSATTVAAGGPVEAIALGDVNGDGKPDLAAALSNGHVAALLGNGAGGFGAPTAFAVGGLANAIGIGDVSGDGKLDLAASSFFFVSSSVSVLLGNGSGGFAAASTVATGGSFPTSLAVASWNGDASLDVAVTQLDPIGASVLFSNGGGAFAAPQLFATGSGPTAITPGDFNADGKLDLATANTSSNDVTVLLNQLSPPTITSQPSGQTVCSGSGASFTVAASNATGYQWRKGGANLSNGGHFSGVATPTLSINPATAVDAASYDCVVSNASGSVTSSAATLAVVAGVPTITAQPISQSKCAGTLASFSITASGAISFQWRKNTVNIGGATSSTLSIASVVAVDAGSYDCVVTNACGPTTSNAASLAVSAGVPTITGQPAAQAKCVGTLASFSIAATGATSFQWRKNLVDIGGATSSTFTIASVAAGDAGNYDCVATNACGSSTSNPASLAVSVGNPTITGQPAAQAKCAGTLASFSITATGATSFQWRKNLVDVGGATASTFTIASVVAGDAGSYDCVATNACGSSTSLPATLAVSVGVPTITDQPANVTTCAGGAASFSVVATGATSFQWRKNTVNIGGATAATLLISPVAAGDAASYDCVVTNACGPATSNAASLAIQTVLFVNANATGANTGKSWTDAFTNLQSALTSPCSNVDVWVAAATYLPDSGTANRAASFQLVSGLKVFGGFAGGETLLSQRDVLAHPTILSGDIGASGVATDNSFHVVTGSGAGASAVLDGFTITAGKSDAGSGGGVEIVGGSPRLERCTIAGNSATIGAGLHVSGAAPAIVRCTFQSNAATGAGGAVWDGGSATLVSCVFRGNSAAVGGGAIFRDVAAGATVVVNAAMTGNTAPSGAAVLNNGTLTLASSTLSLNAASANGGGVRTTGALAVTNSILWGNTDAAGSLEASQLSVAGGAATVDFCDVQGLTGGLGGSGNLGADPKFADANGLDDVAGTADDDLRLRPGSPCIDSASNALVPLDTADLDGDANFAEPTPRDLHEHARFFDDPFSANTGAGAPPLADRGALEECNCEGVPFGTGTPGCQGVQPMALNAPAKIGTPGFAFTCAKAPPSTLGLGMVTNVGDLAGADVFGIGALLHVDLVFSTLVVTLDCVSDPSGAGACPAPIPNNPAFVGLSLFAQTLWVWSSCALPPFQISTSEGLRFTFLP